MRVLHVFNEIKFSGAEIMYLNAAPLFQKSGIDMIALSTGKMKGEFSIQFDELNINVYHRPLLNGTTNPIVLFRYFKNIVALIKNEKIDIIHIHRSTYYCFFSLVGFLYRKKVIRTVHSVFKNRKMTLPKAIIDRFIARKVFGITFQTIGESVYLNELNYYRNPTIKINNWYNSAKFYPPVNAEEKNEFRRKLNIDENSLVLISTGGCTKGKNHHDIIRALTLLNVGNNVLYLHLGQGTTQEEEIALAKTLGVENCIRFLGNKTNVRDYLIASDIYIMPSMFEGLSIASIEAMACALPSVLFNSPGLRDLINNDDNGFLIEPDYKLIAQKVELLWADKDLSKEMGKRANRFVTDNFSMEDGVRQISNLYR